LDEFSTVGQTMGRMPVLWPTLNLDESNSAKDTFKGFGFGFTIV